MTDAYQALALATRRALPVWAEIPGFGMYGGMGTQGDVAAMLGASQATASRILAGRLTVTLAQLCNVAEARGVTLAELLVELEPWATTDRACPDCHGSGRVGIAHRCLTCKGSGARWWAPGSLAGVHSGEPGEGGPDGDP